MGNKKKYVLLCTMLLAASLSGCAAAADKKDAQVPAVSEPAGQEAALSEPDDTAAAENEESRDVRPENKSGDRDGSGGPRSGERGNTGRGGGQAVETDEAVLSVMAEGSEKFQQYTFEDPETGLTLEYNLYIPESYAEDTEYPLIMFIPDATAPGKTTKEIVEQYYGADIWVTEEEQEKHPSFVLVPNFSEVVVDDGFTVSGQVEAVVNLIDSLCSEYSLDTGRLYTTGQSMGCMTSLYLNATYPDLFAASLFVSGQWDISVLSPLEDQTFFYITAGGDAKASGGQEEVMAMFEEDGIGYSYGEWSAQDSEEEQSEAAGELLSQGFSANFIRFETGTVLKDGNTMEHMASFNYAYKIPAVRDWLFEQGE